MSAARLQLPGDALKGDCGKDVGQKPDFGRLPLAAEGVAAQGIGCNFRWQRSGCASGHGGA